MSVPKGKRRKNKLRAFEKAKDMACYTLEICSNKRVFPGRFDGVTKQVVDLAWSAARYLWLANNVDMTERDPAAWKQRKQYQRQGMLCLKELLFEIDMCEKVFGGKREDGSKEKRLDGRKVSTWAGHVVETQELARKWIESDRKRYGSIGHGSRL